MIFEKSAGIIPYDKKSKKFLLLHYPPMEKGEKGHWGFPKGHVEDGETEIQTAKREMKEETGLEVDVVFGFKDEISYFYKFKGKLHKKIVAFFIGIPKSTKVKLSYEHNGYKWVDYEEALKLITFENERKILERAYEFISQSMK